MKKLFAFLFVGIYLITMMGFSINYHFCGGELKNVSVFNDGHVGCCSEVGSINTKDLCQPTINSKPTKEKNCCKKKKVISSCCQKEKTTSPNHSKTKCTTEKESKGCCENKKLCFRIYDSHQHSFAQIIPKNNSSHCFTLSVFNFQLALNNSVYLPVYLGYFDDPPEPKSTSLFLVNRSLLI